jgi:hypothetical protein
MLVLMLVLMLAPTLTLTSHALIVQLSQTFLVFELMMCGWLDRGVWVDIPHPSHTECLLPFSLQ